MSGHSSVGESRIYEAGDQRKVKQADVQEAERYNEGEKHSHQPNDPSTNPFPGLMFSSTDISARG
jgi:hypothetical protein